MSTQDSPSFGGSDSELTATFPSSDFRVARNYDASGKIMLSAVVILVSVVVFMIFLHLYSRWYFLRIRRQNQLRSRRMANTLVFHPGNPSRTVERSQGLDPIILKSLPVFEYSVEVLKCPIDCTVCLSEFTDGESGRTLPKCKHSFHTECIDMWFHSHSTCPLCRTSVELSEPEPESSSSSGSSVKAPRSLNISIEVPRSSLDSGFDNSLSLESSPAQLRSPVGRIISRILSRERKPSTPPATSSNGGCSEIDIECGQQDRAGSVSDSRVHVADRS